MSKLEGYESRGTNIACEGNYQRPEMVEDFGAKFDPLPMAESYYPTRLEYFAGKALQGLVTGRAQKDLNNVSNIARTAVKLAEALEREVDSAKD
jgi:hypothetical protein